LDATLTVTLQPGSGNRTVSELELKRGDNLGILWNTVPGDGKWVLGAASTLDASLHNAANGSVNFAVADGGSFNIFASDSNNSLFPSGATLIVTVKFTDGTSATASATISAPPPPPPATISLAFGGKLRDRVGGGDAALTPDGSLDATLTVTLQPGSGNRTVSELELKRGDDPGKLWNTVPGDLKWVLGATASLDAPLFNAANGSVNFAVADGGSFNVFASDFNNSLFPSGATLIVTTKFTDGTTATASAVIP
jgi:hypothetical protein